MIDDTNFIQIDRHWFLTWTSYGTWLPGDERGFVGSLTNEHGESIDHNQVGTLPASPNGNLRRAAERRLKAAPIVLNLSQAESLFNQFEETARVRGWLLIAVGIMHTHVHLVVGVPQDPDPDKLLRDFKAYGAGSLNRKWGKPTSETWWTAGGSTRKLDDDRGIETVVHYIRNQPNPLLVWTRSEGRII